MGLPIPLVGLLPMVSLQSGTGRPVPYEVFFVLRVFVFAAVVGGRRTTLPYVVDSSAFVFVGNGLDHSVCWVTAGSCVT